MRFEETVLGGERETSEKRKTRELKRQSALSEPTVWIGRNGVTKALLSQIGAQLDANEMIKVKIHKGSLHDAEVSEIASRIAAETHSGVVDVRGRTFSVYKKRKSQTRHRSRAKGYLQ